MLFDLNPVTGLYFHRLMGHPVILLGRNILVYMQECIQIMQYVGTKGCICGSHLRSALDAAS